MNSSAFIDSRHASNLSCFPADLILQGDKAYTVDFFRDLVACYVACYQECGRLNALEAEWWAMKLGLSLCKCDVGIGKLCHRSKIASVLCVSQRRLPVGTLDSCG